MTEVEPIDYEAVRKRFPWVGLADDETIPRAALYREIMTRARLNREAMEAIEAVRFSA